MYKLFGLLARAIWVRRILLAVLGGLTLWVGIAGYWQYGPVLRTVRYGFSLFDVVIGAGVMTIVTAFVPWRSGAKPEVNNSPNESTKAGEDQRRDDTK